MLAKQRKPNKQKKNNNALRQELGKALTTYMTQRIIPNPPARNFAKKRIEVRRFRQISAAVSLAFTLANAHDQFLTVTSTAGGATPYVDSWRIKAIDIYVLPTAGSETYFTLAPSGTDLTSNMRNDEEQLFSVSSRSTTDCAHMHIVPTKTQPLGSWHFTSSLNFAGILFTYTTSNTGGSTSSVGIDITFEVVDNLAGLPLGYTVSTATTTLGAIGGRNISSFALEGINNLG